MDISAVKEHVHRLEQRGSRSSVYRYLQEVWLANDRTEALVVLVMQQMVFYLIELESPWTVWEAEDEHQTYQRFLQEALGDGLAHFAQGKMFLWHLCFYLSAIGTYHFILGKQIPCGSEEALLQRLLADAKELYPASVLFDLIPVLQSGAPLRQAGVSKQAIRAETDEWKLMDNMVDDDLRGLLGL